MKKIILTGGGTGGHIWPHFALFDSASSPFFILEKIHELNVYYLGSKSGMEKKIVHENKPHWKYISIPTGKLRRYFSIQNFIDPLRIILGFLKSLVILFQIKPDVVFSKGGFVTAPVVWAAWILRIPIIIHESDATPALTTKLTLPFCNECLLSFDTTKKYISKKYHSKTFISGLPLRNSLFHTNKIESQDFFSFENSNKKTLLIFGGSLGAMSINHNFIQIVPKLIEKYNIIHIQGKNKFKISESDLKKWKHSYLSFDFLTEEMKYAYSIADLALCRSGASSIFELAAARIPMILFPLGTKTSRGDQVVNAEYFKEKGWAQVLNEDDILKNPFLVTLDDTINKLDFWKKKLRTAPGPDAALFVINRLEKYLNLKA